MATVPQAGGGPLQFERADFDSAATAPACAVCHAPLAGSYFELDGAMSCEACASAARLAANAPLGPSAVFRALAFGTAAALAGTALWFAVAKLTGFEVGLISIVIGMLVGRAVLRGSRGRGGPLFQLIAVVLTYGSITLAYVPDVVQTLLTAEEPAQQASAAAAPSGPTADGQPVAAPADAEPVAATSEADAAPTSTVGMVAALGGLFLLCFAIAAAAPFLAGFENIIGILIIAFGLYEAWKINRRAAPVVVGPLELRAPAASA